MSTEEATINPDGSQTFPEDPTAEATGEEAGDAGEMPEDAIPEEEIATGIDPAIYLALAAVAFVLIFVLLRMRRKRASADVDDFFSNLDGEKVRSLIDCCVHLIGACYYCWQLYCSRET